MRDSSAEFVAPQGWLIKEEPPMRILIGRVTTCALLLGLLASAPGRAEAGTVYGADGQNGNPATKLYILDPATGAPLSTVGPIGFAVSGMSFDPLNGVLYGATAPRGTSTRQLITINTNTGVGTLIGALGVTIDELAFAANGTLYGWSGRTAGSSLYTINLATGAATKVGTSGLTDSGVGFAIDASGTAYLAAAGASGALRTVNLATGAVTTVATLSGAPIPTASIDAMGFNQDGSLLGINLAEGGPGSPGAPGNTFLVTINPTTGTVTSRGASVPGLDALAIQPSAVPEPPTLILMPLGFLGALGLGWKRGCALR
jgi:hypothetical protein